MKKINKLIVVCMALFSVVSCSSKPLVYKDSRYFGKNIIDDHIREHHKPKSVYVKDQVEVNEINLGKAFLEEFPKGEKIEKALAVFDGVPARCERNDSLYECKFRKKFVWKVRKMYSYNVLGDDTHKAYLVHYEYIYRLYVVDGRFENVTVDYSIINREEVTDEIRRGEML